MPDLKTFLYQRAHRLEAPTWSLIVLIYGGWLLLTFWWNSLPVWIGCPLGAWLCAWHMSLQHELLHGHPTRSERINAALAWPPLNLWLPYAIYREQHLRHHQAATLTDPLEDPESTYIMAQDWARAGRFARLLHLACSTLFGRVLLGPPRTIVQFWRREAVAARNIRRAGGKLPWRPWLRHLFGLCLVLLWVCLVCRINPLFYAAFFVYPGTALILVRSLAEHRAAERPEDRTAVVERGGLLGVLYLYNNLHVLHHEHPSIPWYELPGRWRHARTHLLGTRRGPVYKTYSEVFRRHAWRPLHPGPYPLAGGNALGHCTASTRNIGDFATPLPENAASWVEAVG